jgi:hypothetical protein
LSADGHLARRRDEQAAQWLELAVRERWGREGLARFRTAERGATAATPFRRIALVFQTH